MQIIVLKKSCFEEVSLEMLCSYAVKLKLSQWLQL